MHVDWFNAVRNYLGELSGIVDELDKSVDQIRIETRALSATEVESRLSPLARSIARLEAKITERETLLRSESAPTAGANLREKLTSCRDQEAVDLERQCRVIEEQIASAREKAVSLFVCQMNLSELSGDIIHLIARREPDATYGAPQTREKAQDLAGGLFDEAA